MPTRPNTSTMKHALMILLAVVFGGSFASAQSSIKLEKQQTTFFYAQLNLHGGFVNDINGDRWSFATRSPQNQVNLQLFSKNQRNMQRGYTRLIALDSYKVQLGIGYDAEVDALGIERSNLEFKVLDTFVKFKTKWDRTTLTIGNRSIPYGHNPKIDPVVSFMINPIKRDIGFAQDVGVFFKTPISKSLDLEMAFTSGGALTKPVMVCNNLLVSEADGLEMAPEVIFSPYTYEGTWLGTARIGSPTYKRNEFGLNLAAGRIASTTIASDIGHIRRLGADWVFKLRERLKVVNQVMVGQTQSGSAGDFYTLNSMNNIDFYSGRNWMVSASNSFNINTAQGAGTDRNSWSLAGSVTYVFSPHTRLRLNSYYSRIWDANEKQCGVLLQFATGIGKRP